MNYDPPVLDDDAPTGPPTPPSRSGAAENRHPELPFVADLRQTPDPSSTRSKVGAVIILVVFWGLFGGIWLADLAYYSDHKLPISPLVYFPLETLILLALPTWLTIATWRSSGGVPPTQIRVDAAGFELAFSGSGARRWSWSDPSTNIVLSDRSETGLYDEGSDLAFSLSTRGRTPVRTHIPEAGFLALVDSARAAGLDVGTHDVWWLSRRAARGTEFVYLRGRRGAGPQALTS